MKRSSTNFLKIAVILLGIPILALCIFGLPMLAKEAAESNSEFAYVLFAIVSVMYVSAIPYLVALYQAFKLLSCIDKNKAFSEISVKCLKTIKNCAIIICGSYVVGLPFFFIFGHLDDAPGVVLIGMIFIFAPMVIAVFAAVLQKLLQEAISIKIENDLTV